MIGTLRGPRQVIFGPGTLSVVPRLCRENGSRPLIVTDRVMLAQPQVASAVAAVTDAVPGAAVFADTSPEVPLADVAGAREAASAIGADSFLAVGGGSVIDMAKIISVLHRHGGEPADYYGESRVPGPALPLVAVPTTAGTGSEVSPVSVLTDPGRRMKVGVSSAHLIPDSAVVDPGLTLTCPARVTAHSGIDALCHAVESYLARARPHAAADLVSSVFLGRNAVTDDLALRAVRVIAPACPVRSPTARTRQRASRWPLARCARGWPSRMPGPAARMRCSTPSAPPPGRRTASASGCCYRTRWPPRGPPPVTERRPGSPCWPAARA